MFAKLLKHDFKNLRLLGKMGEKSGKNIFFLCNHYD